MANFFFRTATFRRSRTIVRVGILLFLLLVTVLVASVVHGVRGIS
jgi:hypothetical protein